MTLTVQKQCDTVAHKIILMVNIMNTPLHHHQYSILNSLLVFFLAVGLSLHNGIAKPIGEIAWLDVTGEGSVALLTIVWIIAAIASRPPGRVTFLLVLGLNFFMFSALLDVLDEFVRYPAEAKWLSMVESVPAAVGMVVMTLALYQWYQEQVALNKQLLRREFWYRAHEQIDVITQLYRADYWRERAKALQDSAQQAYVVVIDINNFATVNERFGYTEGDRFLREIAQLLAMHIRPVDLASRYAGDRFILLLPEVGCEQAQQVAEEIQTSIKHFAFKTGSDTTSIFHSSRAVWGNLHGGIGVERLLSALNQRLDDMDTNAA